MKIHLKFSVFLLGVILVFASCNKDEGEGGTATIQGKVLKVLYPDDFYGTEIHTDTINASKTDVYIVYGDDTYFGDDVETDKDGNYRFKYLNAGKYTIYAYSTLPSGERIAMSKIVNLERGETLNVDDIYISEGKTFGTSMIKGWVWANYFNKNGNSVGSDWAYEQRVYIRRASEDYYFDDVRVGENGIFMFQKLVPDTYVVSTVTQNTSTEMPSFVTKTIVIDQPSVVVSADTLRVNIKA